MLTGARGRIAVRAEPEMWHSVRRRFGGSDRAGSEGRVGNPTGQAPGACKVGDCLMPSSTRVDTCWECGRTSDTLLPVSIAVELGGSLQVRLCRRCYDSVYVPLVAAGRATPVEPRDRRP